MGLFNRLIKPMSLAIAIVAAAAFILGAVYESLAYTETYDVYQNSQNAYWPGPPDCTDCWGYFDQSFVTSATTTNISALKISGERSDDMTNCTSEYMSLDICQGDAPNIANTEAGHAAYSGPCNGGTSLYTTLLPIETTMATTVTDVKIDLLDGGDPVDVLPNTQYYFEISWKSKNVAGPDCMSLRYQASNIYASGSLWQTTNDAKFYTYKYSDYAYGATTTSQNPLATTAPMIVVPAAWECCYDTAVDDCKIPVYFNEAAILRDTNVLLDEYSYTTYGPILDTVALGYTMNYATELSYYPKETVGVANQARIVEAWYADGVTGNADHIVNMTWANCGGALGGLYLTNALSDPGCVCTESSGLFECGLTRAACWAFKSSTTTMAKFEQSRGRLLSGFPFNIFYQADKQMKIINAADWDAGQIDFYYIGYPTPTSTTTIGSINGTDMRANLDNFGWTYIYFILEKMLQLGFIGLILWRLWHIITGEHTELENDNVDSTLVPRNNSKKRYATKGQVPVINLRK